MMRVCLFFILFEYHVKSCKNQVGVEGGRWQGGRTGCPETGGIASCQEDVNRTVEGGVVLDETLHGKPCGSKDAGSDGFSSATARNDVVGAFHIF